METRGIEAGRAFLRLLVDDSDFAKRLDGSLGKLDGFSRSIEKIGLKMSALGGAITAPFALAIHQFASFGSELHDMSERTGIAVQALTKLSFAANRTGTEMSTVETAIKKMQKALVGASGDGGEAAAAFSKLGLSLNDLRKLSPDQQFEAIGKSLAAITDPAERTALALKIFGKTGTDLIPLINELEETDKRFKRLGITFTEGAAKSADQLAKSLSDLSFVVKYAGTEVGAVLAPEVTKFAEIAANAVATITHFGDTSKTLISVAFDVGVALTLIGTALYVISAAGKAATASLVLFKLAVAAVTADKKLGAVFGIAVVAAAFFALRGYFEDSAEAAKKLNEQMTKTTLLAKKTAEAVGSVNQPEAAKFGEPSKPGFQLQRDLGLAPPPLGAPDLGPSGHGALVLTPINQPTPAQFGVNGLDQFGRINGQLAPPTLQVPTPFNITPAVTPAAHQPGFSQFGSVPGLGLAPPQLLLPGNLGADPKIFNVAKPEDDAVRQAKEQMNRATTGGSRYQFGGRFAEQVFGGGAEGVQQKLLETNRRSEKHLQILAAKAAAVKNAKGALKVGNV